MNKTTSGSVYHLIIPFILANEKGKKSQYLIYKIIFNKLYIII